MKYAKIMCTLLSAAVVTMSVCSASVPVYAAENAEDEEIIEAELIDTEEQEMSEEPAEPETPPAEPTKPETPPVGPTEPGTSPVEPAEPETPPVEPTEPETPPVEPTEPEAPPVEPTEPEAPPVEPTEPETPPVEPAEPETPPVESMEPETPASQTTAKVPDWEEKYSASTPFIAIGDRVCYNVEVPIEGIPSFITQEMIVGALKAQDEAGYPASVTIAQIIQESGFGKYGPGGKEGKGLSYLAFQYCNLFGIKGTGTAGSALLNTFEMTSAGEIYNTKAGFRAYRTYTECIEDRSRLLKNRYSDLTENVTDANTFAMKIGKRWATSITYGQNLISVMERYDLYRLDDMTLMDFSNMIGRFANPCPGSVVTSTFGYRAFDNAFHKGLDMGTGADNIPTYAAEAGTVTYVGEAGAAGNLIIIDHGDGLVTKYMHHAEMYVEEGQHVEKGQQIGLSGTTGRSTGNHLHFQVEENGKAVDPMKYLQEEE